MELSIDQVIMESEYNVILALSKSYDKALSILDKYNGDDLSSFDIFNEAFVMEAEQQTQQPAQQQNGNKPTLNLRPTDKNGKKENIILSILALIPRIVIFIGKSIAAAFKSENVQKVESNVDQVEKTFAQMTPEEKKQFIEEINESDEDIELDLDEGGNVILRSTRKAMNWAKNNWKSLALLSAAVFVFGVVASKFKKYIGESYIVEFTDQELDSINNDIDDLANKVNEVNNGKYDSIALKASENLQDVKLSKEGIKQTLDNTKMKLTDIKDNFKNSKSNLANIEEKYKEASKGIQNLMDRVGGEYKNSNEGSSHRDKLSSTRGKLDRLSGELKTLMSETKESCTNIITGCNVINWLCNQIGDTKVGQKLGEGMKDAFNKLKGNA